MNDTELAEARLAWAKNLQAENERLQERVKEVEHELAWHLSVIKHSGLDDEYENIWGDAVAAYEEKYGTGLPESDDE